MLTERIRNVPASLTLSITAKVKQLKESGVDVIGFAAGEPDFTTPKFIIDAAKEALDKGFTKYTPSGGLLALKQAICDKLKRDNGLSYKPSDIVVSNGAKQSIYNVVQVLVEKGDEVIIPSPYWLSYPEMVTLAGGTNRFVDTSGSGFKLTPEKLKAAINKKTKLLILNSPSNPCGAVYSKKELCALAQVLTDEKRDIFVISDEIYENLIDASEEHFSIAGVNERMFKNVITVNGVSKSYAMTGWRIGYAACSGDIAKACDNLQSHASSNANTIAQHAAIAALSGGAEFIASLKKIFNERRSLIYSLLSKIDGIKVIEPKGTFYLMAGVSAFYGKKSKGAVIKNSVEFCECMLENAHVAAVPGIAFGDDNCIRISYACSFDDIKEGVKRIESFVNGLEP